MPVIPDLDWTASRRWDGPGVVVVTRLRLRRLRDVPAFLRASLAIRDQVVASPGARSVTLRARPLARTFTTVSWWDDEAAVRAFVRTDPHRSSMRRWRDRLARFDHRLVPGTGLVPDASTAEAALPAPDRAPAGPLPGGQAGAGSAADSSRR